MSLKFYRKKVDLATVEGIESGGIKPWTRRVGKTTVRVHEIASLVELEKTKQIIVVMSEQRDVGYLFPMVREIFQERGVEIIEKWTTVNLLPSRIMARAQGSKIQTEIIFIPQNRLAELIRGRGEYYMVEAGHED
jgi:hypothetical protein